LEDPSEDRRILLKWHFKEWDRAWTGMTWLRIGQVAGSYQCGNLNCEKLFSTLCSHFEMK